MEYYSKKKCDGMLKIGNLIQCLDATFEWEVGIL